MNDRLYHSPEDLRDIANPGVEFVEEDDHEEVETEAKHFHVRPNSQQQYQFVSDLSTPMLAAIGGIGSGKTTALGFFIALQMYAEMGSGTIGGIFANTYRQLEQSTLPALWDVFTKMELEDGRDYVYGREPPRAWNSFRSQFKKHNGVLSVRGWGQAVVRSLENYNSIRGLTLGWAALDELRDTKHDAFLVVLGRVRCPKARSRLIRIATSPCGFNWVYKELVENAPKMPRGSERAIIHMPTRCNPDLPPEYIANLEASFGGKYAQQELEGMFVAVTTGAVYHSFSRSMVDPSIVADPSLPFLVTFDFNRNPYCVEIAQEFEWADGTSYLVVIDEFCETNVGTEEMVPKIVDRIRGMIPPDANPSVVVYGDPAGNQRRTTSNQSDYDIIDRDMPKLVGSYSAKYRRRIFPVMETVNAVNALMRRGRFRIHPRCRNTIRDFESVAWKEGTSDIDKDTDKSLTHASDGIRYLVGERYPVRVSRASRVWT